ncbi:hypothetical protein BDC45DRAFT_596863 [Circinella umbellata]|nr:hypothetical protein BDC45DRAFT_596863 [Circinella umbellata]
MKTPKNSFNNYMYKNWIKKSEDLDYFDFANHCKLPEQQTNSHYASILRVLGESDVKKHINYIQVKYQKGKSNDKTALNFMKKYNKYWKHNDEKYDSNDDESSINEEMDRDHSHETIATRLKKRRLKALEVINDSFMEQLEADAKKLITRTFPTIFLTQLLLCHRSIKDVFNWDNKGMQKELKKSFKKDKRESLTKEFELVEANRSDALVTYLPNIEKSLPSVHALQTAIRMSPVLPQEFDYYLHEDYRIAESFLAISPRKALESKYLGDSAGCLITTYIVNTLFTSKNSTKWNGLGLLVGNEAAASLVSEFVGGIRVGTILKKISDEEKMFANARFIVDQNSLYVKKNHCSKVHCSSLYHIALYLIWPVMT